MIFKDFFEIIIIIGKQIMFKRKLNYLTVDTFRGKLMQRTITLDFNNMLGAINGILLLLIYLFIIIMIIIYL